MDRWLPRRGRRSQFRRDIFHRAHARPGPVPGRADFLFDATVARRTDAGRRACLPVRFLLSERIIVSGHISIGERSCILIGACVQVTDRIRIPAAIPVRLPDPDPFHVVPVPEPDPDDIGHSDPFRLHVFACAHADERTFVGTGLGIGIGVAGSDAGVAGPCPADRRRP